jgi:5'-deoxy-5'-methylthioadenosine phosphorylase
MSELGIIGGSGFTSIPTLRVLRKEVVHTPFGEPSAPLTHGALGDRDVVFLPRHGSGHTIPPHKINYRANIWALHKIGVREVVGVAAVGGIRRDMGPLVLVIPDQIIDYTYGRQHTFFEQDLTQVTHIDFTFPYCQSLRLRLLAATKAIGEPAVAEGTYGATQGPRLETAREVQRLEKDGCDIVGMTGMPEAALARELGLCYACCALVVNWAAGKAPGIVSLREIEQNLHLGMEKVHRLLAQFEEVNSASPDPS